MKPSDTRSCKTLASTEVSEEPNKTNGMSKNKYWTIPNIICAIRLFGAIGLFWIAMQNHLMLFIWVFIALSLSDTLDGRIARWFNLRSDFGARLDSFADSVLYLGLFFGLYCFCGDAFLQEAPWWLVGLFSYVLTTGAGLWKYGRIPSYHTYGAKLSQWFVLAGALFLLLDSTPWPFRFAMLIVTLTNLEATAITWILPHWQADILSLGHVLWPASRSELPNPENPR